MPALLAAERDPELSRSSLAGSRLTHRSDEVEADAQDGVEGEEPHAFQPVALSVVDDQVEDHHRADHGDDFGLREDQVHGLADDGPGNDQHRRHEHGDLSAGAGDDAEAQVHLVLVRHHDSRAVLGGVADDGEQDDTDEYRRHAQVFGDVLDVFHQVLGEEEDRQRGTEEDQHRLADAPTRRRVMPVVLGVGDRLQEVTVRLQVEDEQHHVQRDQHQRNRQRNLAVDQLPLAADVVDCRRHQERHRRDRQHGGCGARRHLVERLLIAF